jgi:hypothetical protein
MLCEAHAHLPELVVAESLECATVNQDHDRMFAWICGLAMELVNRMTFGKKLAADWFDLRLRRDSLSKRCQRVRDETEDEKNN